MGNTQNQNAAKKVFLALLPTILFWQNYSWMTANAYLGLSFLIIWALMVWNIWTFTDKNQILERCFRLTEIGFFLLPLSAIIFSIVMGSQAVTSTTDEFAQAGAAIGSAVGGFFIVVLAFILGITGGIIMHTITGKYEKKVDESLAKKSESLSYKHGTILSVLAIFILAIILGSVSAAQNSENLKQEKIELSNSLQQAGSPSENITSTKQIELEIVGKGFHKANYMAGEYQDKITFDLKLVNKESKDILGVQGIVTFYNLFDDEIFSSDMSYDKGLKSSEEVIWNTSIDYNQFMDEHQKLKDTKINNLKYKWEIGAIVYEDGSKETF